MESARMAQILRFFAGEGLRDTGRALRAGGDRKRRLHHPALHSASSALITPWNFPAAIPAWKAAPALAYGNTVVMKLAQDAPLTGLHLAACLEEGGIPAGVFNVVVGRGSDGRHAARRAPARPGDLVHRLGRGRRAGARAGDGARQARPARARRPQPADRHGRRRSRSRRRGGVRRRVLVGRPEMHGDSPDPRRGVGLRRVPLAAAGAGSSAASSATRPIPQTEVGPIVNESQLEEVLAGIEQGRADGGTLLTGGERLDDEAYPRRARRCSRGSLTTPSCRARRCSARSRPLYRFRTLDEALRARERGRVRAVGVDLHVEPRLGTDVRAGDRGRDRARQRPDRRRGRPRALRRRQELRLRPARAGPRRVEFYTELVTVYEDV